MADLRDGVALTELGVITRWSLAVRQPEAERSELIEALRSDLAWLESSRPRPTSGLPSLRREPSARTAAAPRRFSAATSGAVPAADAPEATVPVTAAEPVEEAVSEQPVSEQSVSGPPASEQSVAPAVKRGPGRPRKVAAPRETP